MIPGYDAAPQVVHTMTKRRSSLRGADLRFQYVVYQVWSEMQEKRERLLKKGGLLRRITGCGMML